MWKSEIIDGERKVNVFSIFHYPHLKEDKGLALLPISPNSLRMLHAMRKGDYILFEGDPNRKEILGFSKLRLQTTIADLLCRYIYGVGLDRVEQRWENNLVALGEGRAALDKEFCWMIYYKK